MNTSFRPWFLRYDRANFPKDLFSSLVVFLVALPLCMGVAIASGVPPALGLITGIIGGIVAGALAGSPLQVSGPAAGLTVIVYEIVHQHGLGMLGVIVLMAGLLQLAAGMLKIGPWFRAISPAVVQGMLGGIGLLIIASQVHVLVDDKPRSSGVANLLAIPEAIWKGIVPLDGSSHHLAAAVGLATLAVIVAWGFMPKQVKAIPAPLVGVVFATLVVAVFKLPVALITLPNNLWTAVQFPTFANFSHILEGPILIAAVTLAIVASAETMLCATAADAMHSGERTNYDQELISQGVGNMLCGVVGALPMTGVIVRSGANIQAGARTRLSAVMHGAWILVFVAALPFLLTRIPTTALAALLVYSGFKLLAPKTILGLKRYGKTEVAICLATIVAIVATNLLEGIMIGVALALAKQLYTLSHLEVRLEEGQGHDKVLYLKGAATFVGLPKLAATLQRVPAKAHLHVEMEGLYSIDHACLELLSGWAEQHRAAGGDLTLEWDTLHHTLQRSRPSSLKQAGAGTAELRA
jgi:MFS superfamily sulfate permease-like transporter